MKNQKTYLTPYYKKHLKENYENIIIYKNPPDTKNPTLTFNPIVIKKMSNFNFLKQPFPELFNHATQAEKLIYSAPRASCFYARFTLEQAVI